MVLRYSIGKRIAGNVCAADAAFNDFERQIRHFETGPAWDWFVDRVVALESELDAVGGFDERIADQLETMGSVMLPIAAADRYEQASNICWLLDEAAAAFIVTLQPRLNALGVAASAIYEKAAAEDALQISIPRKLELFPSSLVAVWDVANYVKHRDEWRTELNKLQQPSFETLLTLGVATGTHDARELSRFPTIESLCALSDKSCLREAIPAVLECCAAAHREMAARIQSDFLPLANAVEALRATNRRRTPEICET